jgi:NADH-ubiquinone oxidoreductase chain 5
MYLSIILLPLFGAITSGFIGRKIGVKGSQFITCSSIGITTILCILAFLEVGMNNILVFIEMFR